MSRHRNVRNLSYDDMYDDYEEEYSEDDVDPVDSVQEIVGKRFNRNQIKKMLERCDYDLEQTVDALLSQAETTQFESKPVEKKPPKKAQQLEKEPPKKVQVEKKPVVETIVSDMEALGLKQEPSEKLKPLKGKRINIQEEYSKRKSEKPRMNLVVIGHVDSGKSTCMGHLLLLLGEVSQNTYRKYQRDSEVQKKGSFSFAWVLDETEEERSRGVTIDVAVSKFSTPNREFTLLDAPGHRDFIPNMISGASQADVALLVVDSTMGEFESGFEGGQTKEHAILVRSLGVSQLVVGINKMDTVGWNQERFDQISAVLKQYLHQIGFKSLIFVPMSGYTGENLLKRSDGIAPWYQGKTLVEALDSFEPPAKNIDGPFRLSVQDVYKGGMNNMGGDATVSGRIESGSIQVGDPVLALPINESGHVKAIAVAENNCKYAVCGDRVSITLAGLEVIQLGHGTVLCTPEQPMTITNRFEAKIMTLDIETPLTIGVPVVMHHLGSSEPATITKMISILDRAGNVSKKNPRVLTKNTNAVVEITLSRPIPCEIFSVSKELSRFTLRSGSTSVGAGVIVSLS
ncbi:HBS1-like protein [Gorgonomyces haynaldii]|nr:HBS1-like protein [Gorgonomyces haynaldii]